MMNVPDAIAAHKIVAIVRGTNSCDIIAVVDALYRGGIRLLEVTLNSPGALDSITRLSAHCADRMWIGAGTVLNAGDAHNAIDAGAGFIISPIVDAATIHATKQRGIVSIPGAFTPTEIVQAHLAGADIVKVFPAGSPSYIKDIRGPLPHIALMPTGGVHLQNIADFLAAGAIAVGVGSALVNGKEAVTDLYLQKLEETARAFIKAIH